MSEITYTYVKGQGWVPKMPEIYPTLHARIGVYNVTLIHKVPEPGEYYWAERPGYKLEQTYQNIRGWRDFDQDGLESPSQTRRCTASDTYAGSSRWTVIKWEHV